MPWFGALALEGRAKAAQGVDLAAHAAWVAANVMAACGSWVKDGGVAAAVADARVLYIAAEDPRSVLAALAVVPALPLAPSLSYKTRAVLRLLGIPTLDAVTLAGGARIAVGDPAFAHGPLVSLDVRPDATGYTVGPSADHRRLLVARG